MEVQRTVPEPPLVVRRGQLLAYRLFDVGDELALDRAEHILADNPGRRRMRLSREGSEFLIFAALPLVVELGRRTVRLERLGKDMEADLTARFFDYGVVSLMYTLQIEPGTPMTGLTPLCDELYESPALERVARKELDALLDRLGPAIQGLHHWGGVETYTVILVEELDGNPSGRHVLHSEGLDKLLIGETASKPLAPDEREDLQLSGLSYFEDDLTVIDWNSAFVLEPSGSHDIPEILEFATSQLLELRYYDDLLDRELNRIYDQFAVVGRQQRLSHLINSPYDKLARDVLRRWIELSEFTERVENAVKTVGDFYLARVYRNAVTRFQLRSFQAAVDQKLSLVAQVYSLLRDETHHRRGMLLELTVVFLIAFEILMAFVRH
jgi:hypothetical protein